MSLRAWENTNRFLAKLLSQKIDFSKFQISGEVNILTLRLQLVSTYLLYISTIQEEYCQSGQSSQTLACFQWIFLALSGAIGNQEEVRRLS